MARSSRTQADENRARIVKVASGLFRAHGIEAVGIADVMKAAGMTQGGFYRHFRSKNSLAAEACAFAFDGAVEKWNGVAGTAMRKGEDPTDAIVAYYLAPKPPEMLCPMVALSSDVGRRSEDDELRRAYGLGVQRLTDTFITVASMGGHAAGQAATHRRFAAMVGARMLSSSMGRSLSFEDAVRRSAE